MLHHCFTSSSCFSLVLATNIMSSTNETNVRLRHACAPKYLVQVNNGLTPGQQGQLRGTPFEWAMHMPPKLKISGLLLMELVTRWDHSSQGFRVNNRIVPFTPTDVCLALGLPVLGEHVPSDESEECHKLALFDGGEVTIETIMDRLTLFEEDVSNFCRMYILLACGEFYFPRSGRLVYTAFIKLLDDLQSLNGYNWGVAVYDFLVKSLTNASRSLTKGKNQRQLHLGGCVAVLQIWALSHVLETPKVPPRFPFPRFLNWQQLRLGKKRIHQQLDTNLVIVQLTPTAEEVVYDMVRDALQQAEHRWALATELQQLVALNAQCQERISALEAEVKSLKDAVLHRQTTTEPGNEYERGAPSMAYQQSPLFPSPHSAGAADIPDDEIGESPHNTGGEVDVGGSNLPPSVAVGGVEDEQGVDGENLPPSVMVGGVQEQHGVDENILPVQHNDGQKSGAGGADVVDHAVETTTTITTRVKNNPRLRYKSIAVRTPYETRTYARTRKGKQKE